MPCQKYPIFIFIFIFCNRNANFCSFLQWQCNLFNLLCIDNTNFLILAFAIQMFCIFCIGDILFFHFWHWECKFFLKFVIGNAFFKNMFVCLFVTDATLLSRRVPNEGTRSIARESVSYI